MFDNIKKIIKNPTNLTIIFYGATLLVLLERLFALCYTLVTTKPMNFAWSPYEYTLAILLPLAGFAYFCSSKYAKNTNNKVKAYVGTYVIFALLYFCILAQIANSFVWFILDIIGLSGTNLENAINTIPTLQNKLALLVRVITIYLPLSIVPLSISPVAEMFNSEHSINGLRNLNIISGSTSKSLNIPKCDVKLCTDLATGTPVIVSEERRMETVLVQGATGTGKTSTMLLPMCASDLHLKYRYKLMAKDAAMKALENGCAFVNSPASNEYLNKYFSLNLIHPIKGKENEYYSILGDLVKAHDLDTSAPIFRDLGITVLEPDGNYIQDFKTIAHNFGIPVYTIDPLDPDSFGINPFINKSPAKVASIISTVLKGMYESEDSDSSNAFFGQVTQQALENLAILLKLMYPRMNNGEIPTLEDMLKMLYDYSIVEEMCEELKKDPVLSKKHAILIKYFERNFYAPPLDINGRPVLGTVGSNRRETEQFLYGATTQLDNLMRNKAVRKILCERKNNIDLDRVLAEGLCVTVCTRRGELGALLSKPFGMFYILTMQDAVLRRPGDENTRIPHFFYIDEFPDFVNKETETCFTLFRKYRCAMTIAIQNLSQLERTQSMKFYKEVVTSNSKTVAVFGDTNKEDSEYWAKSFGKFEYWDISNTIDKTPLGNISSPKDAGLNGESIGVGFDFTFNIFPWALNELPFRQVFYKTRNPAGKQIFGRGTTDFVDKKYLSPFSEIKYNFEKFSSPIPNDSKETITNIEPNIIDDENYMNDILIGATNISVPVINTAKVIKESEDVINNIEYIDNSDVKIEIDI